MFKYKLNIKKDGFLYCAVVNSLNRWPRSRHHFSALHLSPSSIRVHLCVFNATWNTNSAFPADTLHGAGHREGPAVSLCHH